MEDDHHGPYASLERSDLEALVATSQQLSAQLSLTDLLGLILETACDHTDSPDSALFLYDRERDALYAAAATGSSSPELLERFGRDSIQRIPMQSRAGGVVQTGEPVIIGDLSHDADHYKGTDRQTGHQSESMISAPLSVQGVAIGAMQVLNRRTSSYGDRDLAVVQALASHAALAIRNAQLVEDLLAHMGLGTGGDPFALVAELDQPPRQERLTIMFADMRSFTQLSNMLNAESLQLVLNEFLTMLCDEVVLHSGVVNKLVGDGIVAIFRGDEHARRAVECAFAMGRQFDRLRQKWNRSNNAELGFIDIGIGLATDEVVLATLGSRQVRDFTPLGAAVNLAHAFEFAARDGHRIYCDQQTYEQVRDLAEPCAEAETFELTKPGQAVKVPYKRYELRSRPLPTSQVFLSHNSDDKPTVRELASLLKDRGVSVWLDEDQLVPGRPWQDALEEIIETADSTAVLVGNSGLGPWEVPEMRAALSQFVERRMPVIPVLLPDAPPTMELPVFLREYTWVDLRGGLDSDGINRLLWGITGTKPAEA